VTAQRSPHQVVLSEEQRRELERRAAAYSSPHRDVVRARAILLAAEGLSNTEIGERLAQSRQAVSQWRRRFCEEGLLGLEERPRPGRPRRFSLGAGGCERTRSARGTIARGSFHAIRCSPRRPVRSSICTRAARRGSCWSPAISLSAAMRSRRSKPARASTQPKPPSRAARPNWSARIRAQGRAVLPRRLGRAAREAV
jgi:hypothetical protein